MDQQGDGLAGDQAAASLASAAHRLLHTSAISPIHAEARVCGSAASPPRPPARRALIFERGFAIDACSQLGRKGETAVPQWPLDDSMHPAPERASALCAATGAVVCAHGGGAHRCVPLRCAMKHSSGARPGRHTCRACNATKQPPGGTMRPFGWLERQPAHAFE